MISIPMMIMARTTTRTTPMKTKTRTQTTGMLNPLMIIKMRETCYTNLGLEMSRTTKKIPISTFSITQITTTSSMKMMITFSKARRKGTASTQ
jgi:hypothetical protein|tara:strand:+ start:80 stop:358 length:279 start_codon:yes stop_codon:yes gene_type:complete